MDIQLFATDEELQDFPETKTDSTVPDKTPKSNSINLAASDLPRSHSHLPRIPSRLPERKLDINPEEIIEVDLDPIPKALLLIGKQV